MTAPMKSPAGDGLKEGDVVALQAGERVPADLRLLEAEGLEVDEFDLTGEIAPQPKRLDAEDGAMLFHGSLVVRGRGSGVVVAAGERTEYGRLSRPTPRRDARSTAPPLRRRHLVLPLALTAALVWRWLHGGASAAALASYGGSALLLWTLPNLARLRFVWFRRKQAALRRSGIRLRDARLLPAMRSVDCVCFDKTGVLTSREMRVKRLFQEGAWVDAEELRGTTAGDLVVAGCALCHDAVPPGRRSSLGALDRALMAYAAAHGTGTDAAEGLHPRIYFQPFLPGKRYMAVGFARGSADPVYFAKGDPEAILAMCSRRLAPSGESLPLDAGFRAGLFEAAESVSRDGSVVIALACAEGASPPTAYRFLCLLQLENPVAPQAAPTLQALAARGVRTIMLTGDRVESALGAARQSGIRVDGGLFLTGKDLGKMDFAEIVRQSSYISVFARLLPSQKGLVVNALRQAGHRVAMVGDGANDAIAIRAADIGISLRGQSSPLARRSAAVLIGDLTDIVRLIAAAGDVQRRVWILATLIAVTLLGLMLNGPLPDLIGLIGAG